MSKQNLNDYLRLIELVDKSKGATEKQQKSRRYGECIKLMSDKYDKREALQICGLYLATVKNILEEVDKRTQILEIPLDRACQDFLIEKQQLPKELFINPDFEKIYTNQKNQKFKEEEEINQDEDIEEKKFNTKELYNIREELLNIKEIEQFNDEEIENFYQKLDKNKKEKENKNEKEKENKNEKEKENENENENKNSLELSPNLRKRFFFGSQSCSAVCIGQLLKSCSNETLNRVLPILQHSCDIGNILSCDLVTRIYHEPSLQKSKEEKEKKHLELVLKIEELSKDCFLKNDSIACNEVGSYFMQNLEEMGKTFDIFHNQNEFVTFFANKAQLYFQKACVTGNSDGCFGAGIVTFNFNQKNYLKWFLRGCDLGNENSCSYGSNFLLENKQIEEAIKYAKKGTKLRACEQISYHNIYATIAEENLKKRKKRKILENLKLSCMNCLDPEHCFYLSRLYYDSNLQKFFDLQKNIKFQTDFDLAKKYLKVSCGLGEIKACENLYYFPTIPKNKVTK